MREGIIKSFKKIPRKRKIQLGIAFAVILVIISILIAYNFFNIFAAEDEIANTATIYYQEGGVDESAQSNTVITAVLLTFGPTNVIADTHADSVTNYPTSFL